MRNGLFVFAALCFFVVSVYAKKLTKIQYQIKVTVVVEKDAEKDCILAPDTMIVHVPKNDITVSNIEVTPGHWGPCHVFELEQEHHIVFPESTWTLHLPPLNVDKPIIYSGYVPADTTVYNLNFGTIYCGKRSGIVVLTPEGHCVAVCGVKHPSANGEPAVLKIQGRKNAVFDLTFPKETQLIRSGGKETVMVQYFYPSTYHFQLDSLGKQIVQIGALLFTNESQVPGNYAGEFIVELSYYKEPVIVYKEE